VAALVEKPDGDDYGALLSELSERGVLILGRFTDRRRRILEAIGQRLRQHLAQAFAGSCGIDTLVCGGLSLRDR
jgi:hypothetical protein